MSRLVIAFEMGSRYSDSECNLKVELARFANVIQYGYERRKM